MLLLLSSAQGHRDPNENKEGAAGLGLEELEADLPDDGSNGGVVFL